ncbi:MAG: dTDP-glucose 4,6-dehydratase [Bacteroidales bacterium]|nr:dTDP-glucose 4,6-dehydratase [Bacteroidales bacterium]
MDKTILITGGAGFIGSHVVRQFIYFYPDYLVVNVDKLTYAGNLENLRDVEHRPNYRFERVDIVDPVAVRKLFEKYKVDGVVHLAAESHVDRSISSPMEFIYTNIIGTVNLLNACKEAWKDTLDDKLFYHISTDEVYGTAEGDSFFTESTAYDPRSPYSASKASSDHLVRAYHNTFKLPVVISNCSNNYGPNQFPEKLIPLVIHNIKNMREIPVYGKGENIRDWLYVIDHARAIDQIFHMGVIGETYNIGGCNEWKNIDVVKLLCTILDEKLDRKPGTSAKLITYVKDRAGHDLRYAIDASKLQNELGWETSVDFEKGLKRTVDWYLDNEAWVNNITSGEYEKYYERQYKNR